MAVAIVAGSALASAAAAIPAAAAGGRARAAMDYWDSIEVDPAVFDAAMPQRVLVQTSDGQPVATFYNENRVPVASLEEVSPTLVKAVLAVEDREFYEHGPVDVSGLARAAARNLTTGTQQGGSTITQQYVKLLRAAAGEDDESKAAATEGTLGRKITELRYAAELERRSSKDDILLGYLNAAYFGDGAYGVGAAAAHYFDTTPAQLDIAQSALLAGLLRNPNRYNPNANPLDATARRDVALNAMRATGAISEGERAFASAAPLGAASHELPNGCSASPWPYYCDWVRATLLTDEAFGPTEAARAGNLVRGGFTVVAALDPAEMADTQRQLDAALGRQDVAGAAAVIEPGSGRVTAIAATRDYASTQFNIPVQGQLQVGSTFKPITLAAALARGFTPDATISAPHPYVAAAGNSPVGGFRNLDGISRGPIAATTALKYSVNTWFVRLTEQVGVTQVADTAFDLGMRSMDPATRSVGDGDLSITLGAFETTVLDAANVYATLAASGVACRPMAILSVTETSTGASLPAPDPNCRQSVAAPVADNVTAALHATAEPGGTAAEIVLPGQDWVGKTGTTNDFGATWFIGATRSRAAAVWVGDPRGPSYSARGVTAWGRTYDRVYGATVAEPLWNRIMSELTADVPLAPFPTPGPLTVSSFTTPHVVGMNVSAARAVLEAAGLHVTVAAAPGADSQEPAGTVLEQDPAGGTSTASDVTLVVSGGPS
ncbi:membrane peptidoglycan carboxypeptidase [Cellulomonas hominis]|uniref:Membrane peptidoglycan carboxypeptidase n=1 Tax=Cellulomonas hominis TaxID=156981 RepID=A0A7W8SGD8_9CELL|nr:transglycosylase domain-containing protein [Cellulomonas hominis]MBB5474610.1 membrane peptidoglycan carboxypeptidase [Cellulomonas hominis]